MTVSNIKASVKSNIHKVWQAVSAPENYSWRTDLSKTEIIDEKHFIEYAQNGYPTNFEITFSEPCRRLEFNIENSNMTGRWVGIFTEKDGSTEIDFTEYVTVKKIFMKPFAKLYLKKQQSQFVSDLQKAMLQ